jgi:STAS-like domain of unknown function (DUF4325)
MREISVVELVGPICVDPEAGTILCAVVRDSFSLGLSVKLDFTGVKALTSSFLNSAVGCLLASIPEEAVRARLSWSGLDEIDDELVSLVLRNASRFYSASPNAREALAAASSSIGED